MLNMNWKLFLSICRETLGKGSFNPYLSESWCSFTTFTSLSHNINYWSCGFPDKEDLLDDRTIDGGLWRQSFYYDDIAHIIIPSKFYWEEIIDNKFCCDYKKQNINLLIPKLGNNFPQLRQTELMLEVKLY